MDWQIILDILPSVLLEGLLLGLVYAMIALGYSMVYGVLGLINFAHSEVFMIGAVAGAEVMIGCVHAGPAAALVLALLAGALVSGMLAVLIERVAYRPLRRRASKVRLVPLITAIGVSFFLQDAARLYLGLVHDDFYRVYPNFELLERTMDLPLQATIQGKGIVLMGVAALMLGVLWFLVVRTPMGRAIRAVAQDREAASLMGIDPDRVITRTFFLGGCLGGVAGVLFGLLYTQINPYSGFFPGIKAFTAAVLGGIGSIPGAALGGLFLGVLEIMGGTYLPLVSDGNIGTEYKDIFAFAVLIAILLFKPSGLLGRGHVEKV